MKRIDARQRAVHVVELLVVIGIYCLSASAASRSGLWRDALARASTAAREGGESN